MPDPTGRVSHLPEMHRGVSWKQPVRAATTANITRSTALNPGDSLDGVTLASGDRVLVKDQSTANQNGIFVVAGTPFRAYDMDQDESTSVPAAEIVGSFVYVLEGTTNAATLWYCTTTGTPVIDTDDIAFAQWTGGAAGTAYVTKTDGGSETVFTDTNVSGTAYTIDIAAGNWQDLTLTGTATCTFAFTGADDGEGDSFVILLRQDGSGNRGPAAWPAAVIWPNDTEPTLGTAASAVDVLTFLSRDAGTTWFGFHAGSGGGSAATPGLTFTTTNAQGAASTFVATDASLAIFDATAPTTLAYDDAAATGAAAVAARRDHVHGMPSAQGGIGEILITDTPSGTPIAFVDLLVDETGLDLLYADP